MNLLIENTKRTIYRAISVVPGEPRPLLQCDHCNRIQEQAIYWDYQKCEYCGAYLYDDR